MLVRRSLQFGALDIALLCNCHNFVTHARRVIQKRYHIATVWTYFPHTGEAYFFQNRQHDTCSGSNNPHISQEGNKCLNYVKSIRKGNKNYGQFSTLRSARASAAATGSMASATI